MDKSKDLEKKLKKNIKRNLTFSFYFENQIQLEEYKQKLDEGYFKTYIEFLIQIIDSPENLLDTDLNLQYNFLKQPEENHEIFKSVNLVIDTINSIKELEGVKKDKLLEKILNSLLKGYEDSKINFVSKAKYNINNNNNSNNSNPMDIFKPKFKILLDNLEYYEQDLKSIYPKLSYSLEHLDFKRTYESGVSCVSKEIDGVCYKVDRGNENRLRPVKEYGVYHFYCILFEKEQKIISPTSLLFFQNVPICDSESPQYKSILKIKENNKFQTIEETLLYFPAKKQELYNSFISFTTPVQANLFQNGETLHNILEPKNSSSPLTKILDELSNSENFMFSFGAHFLVSLLLNFNDAKSDNLIYNSQEEIIIGIDNDDCMKYKDFERTSSGNLIIKFKNILFTLHSIMARRINNKVKSEFLKINPYGAVIEWLTKMYDKENAIISQIKKLINSDQSIINKEESLKITMGNLGIPHVFPHNWVNEMLDRLIKIFNILNLNNNITHSGLFKEIYPLASFYYNKTSTLPTPNEQNYAIFHDYNKIEEYLKNDPQRQFYFDIINRTNYNTPDKHQTIKESIESIVSSLKVSDLINKDNSWSFIHIVNLLFDLSKKQIINDKTIFDSTWYSLLNDWLVVLINNSIEEQEVDQVILNTFELLKIEKTHLNEPKLSKPIIYSIIENVKDNKLMNNIIKSIKLLEKRGCDVDCVYNGIAPLDLVQENRNKIIFQTLINLGAGKNSDPITINNYYQSLSLEEKLEINESINKLKENNSKINWLLSFDHLFQKISISGSNDLSENRKLYFFNKEYVEERILRTDTEIDMVKDGLHKICIKRNTKFPGYHFAFNSLYTLLFDQKLPVSEMGIINGQPVLLYELNESKNFRLEESQIGNLFINNSSLSQLIIMLVLFEKFEDNLDDYIIDSENNIYSIINDNCFLPLKNYRNAHNKVRNTNLSIFSLKQMDSEISFDVVTNFLNLDISKLLNNFLKDLEKIQLKFIELFFNNNIKCNISNSFLGVLLYGGQFKKLFRRIKALQNLFKKIKTISLNQIVDYFLGNAKFKSTYNIFGNEPSINEIMKQYGISEEILKNPKIITKYGPSKAIIKFGKISSIDNIRSIINDLNSSSSITRQCKVSNLDQKQIKSFIKYLKREEITKSYESYTIDLLNKNGNKINYLSLKNFQTLESQHLTYDLFENLQIINLSGCSSLTDFSPKSKLFSFQTKLLQIEKLSLNNCKNLATISISAPKLKFFSAFGCTSLIDLKIDECKNLKNINLSNGTLKEIKSSSNCSSLSSNRDSRLKIIFNSLSKLSTYKHMETIDISNNQLDYVDSISIVSMVISFESNGIEFKYDKIGTIYKITVLDYLELPKENPLKNTKGEYGSQIDLNIKTLTGVTRLNKDKVQMLNSNTANYTTCTSHASSISTDNSLINIMHNGQNASLISSELSNNSCSLGIIVTDEKSQINRVYKYLNNFIHISYRLNPENFPSKNNSKENSVQLAGLLLFNPLDFDLSSIKEKYNSLNSLGPLKFNLFGVSNLGKRSSINGQLPPDDVCFLNLHPLDELLLERYSIKSTIWYEINTLFDEETVRNQLFSILLK
ncbi:hypothetical protein DICPUDRAFT_157103 [Dictyostelium purpureum]|uniref:Uncharacterized protein n=1 Tax=Dictyostelium purpureum TaxID=5786 RepID=F0ZY96_DICPU|nr:uncharacterized protein DICPUDRAFT_157103 [Dictyostelium purpureum]EGC31087.1 hypothetical protein DICPUDRAFT_157103 [Dictyostelium purpureum]|eukprot:XP_003292388.1 hypothetical protein DICPUDRAFT_157103 [Dictyostelium purpureum]